MSAAPATRRAAAEIEGQAALYRIGNRSIHQYWHLFAAHFRHVLLAPQRRPDSGRIAWTWREDAEPRPVTATELTEVRRRLSEANQSLTRGFDDSDSGDISATSAEALEGQVRVAVSEMVAQLLAQRDAALHAFVCRTDAGVMLHSWGASSAAKPFFPDAQHGEISGNVVIGSDHPAGVTVALENGQGTVLMRSHSDHEGLFHFSNVAPGNYRVRVLDRSDFPTDGTVVTMGRDSITGLELRGTPADLAVATAALPSVTGSPPPWYARKWVAVIAVLAVLGIGGCIWNSYRTGSEKKSQKTKDSSWQSANGNLPGAADQKAIRDDRKVGSDGAFSSLSNSLPPPKTLSPADGRRDSGDKKPVDEKFHETPESRGDRADADTKKQSSDGAEKGNLRNPPPDATKPMTPSGQPSPDKSSVGSPVSAETVNDDIENGKAHTETANPVDGSSRPRMKKTPGQAAAKSFTTDAASSLASPGAEAETGPDSLTPNVSAGPKDGTAKSASGKGRSPAHQSAGAPSADGSAADDGQDLPESAKSNAPANSAPAKSNQKPAPVSGANSSGASPPATEPQPAPTVTTPTPDESGPTDSSEQNGSSKANRSRKPSRPKVEVPLAADASTATDAGAKEAETDGVSPDKRAKVSAAPAQKKSALSKPAGVASAVSELPVDLPPPTPGAAADTSNAPSNGRAKSAAKSARSSSSPSQSEQPPDRSAENPVEETSAVVGARRVASEGNDLTRIGTIRASSWKVRLVQDLIVPTRPLTAREEEQLTALRQKLQQERATHIPQVFKSPRMKSGVTVSFAGDLSSPTDTPQWRDGSGRLIPDSLGRRGIAGLEWEGTTPAPSTFYVLRAVGGKMLARAEVDASGSLIVTALPNARVSYWVGIVTDAASDAMPRMLEWRQLAGEAIPKSWSRDDAWLDGKGRRIEIPLDAESVRVGHYGISLVDPGSGWALVGEVGLQ